MIISEADTTIKRYMLLWTTPAVRIKRREKNFSFHSWKEKSIFSMATSQEHISFDTFVRRKKRKKKTFMEFSLLIWSNVFVCWLCELVGFYSDFRWLATFQYENIEYFGCNLKCILLYLQINQMWMCFFSSRKSAW